MGSSEEGGVPFAMVWQPDDSLLILRKTSVGGGVLMLSPKRKRVRRSPYRRLTNQSFTH